MITRDVYKILFINIWILALGMIMNYAAEISNLFIAVICLVLVFKGVKKVKYSLLVSSRKIIRLSIITIILNLIVFEYYNLDVTTDFVPIEYCLYLIAIAEALAMKEDVQVLSREEINKYSKVKSLQSLLMSGLNVHEFYVCKNFESLWQSYIALGKECTIRTDKAYAKPGSQLGFFIARYIAPSELKKIADVIKQNGCIAIISNGLKYDDHLRYNIVYKIEENGDFYCEFSRLKVPLRHMYRHPETLNSASGNIDELLKYWNRHVSKQEKYRIDFREIRELLREEYKLGMFGKTVEMSVYNVKCGILNKNKVYWEII